MLSIKLQLLLGSFQFMDESVIQIPIPFLSAFLTFYSHPPFKCLKILMNQIAEVSEPACCVMPPKRLWKCGSVLCVVLPGNVHIKIICRGSIRVWLMQDLFPDSECW